MTEEEFRAKTLATIRENMGVPEMPPETFSKFKEELKAAIEYGKATEYSFNGVDEYSYEVFDEDASLEEVLKLLSKWNLLHQAIENKSTKQP
jgi:hypothetical protein